MHPLTSGLTILKIRASDRQNDKAFDERRYEAFTENVTDEFKANFERNCETYHRVIDTYEFEYIGQYVKLYVCMDTLQLADIL